MKKMQQFIRFAIVGALATAIHYGLYLLIVWANDIGEDETLCTNIAYSIGYLVSWCVNFYLSAHFTFKSNTSLKRGIGFALSHGVNYLLHILFLNPVSYTHLTLPTICSV